MNETNDQGNGVKVGGRNDTCKYDELQLVKNPKEIQPNQEVRRKVEKEYKVNKKLQKEGVESTNILTRPKRTRKAVVKLDL